MPEYIEWALTRFLHIYPKRPHHSPFAAPLPVFGKTQQLTPPPDTPKALNNIDIKHVQETIGALLYQARALDSPPLAALNTLETEQAALRSHNYSITALLIPILSFVRS